MFCQVIGLLALALFCHGEAYLFSSKSLFHRRIVPKESPFGLALQESAQSVETDYCLTPVLASYAASFHSVVDDKLRYQQLLFLAAKAKPMDASLKVDNNKVRGCLSTVYVHAHLGDDGLVYYQGDSDSQLTKGLVTLLVNGLSGNSAEDILKVKPEFVQYAGIAKSLTPGRNNGFLNMLNLMKVKAEELKEKGVGGENNALAPGSTDQRPIYHRMVKKLTLLKPVKLDIEDQSHQHAGHMNSDVSQSGETHFAVNIVAECFEGLSLVQRHKMIYTLLAQELNDGVHALSIVAQTPEENQIS
eukprot:gene10140-11223_t